MKPRHKSKHFALYTLLSHTLSLPESQTAAHIGVNKSVSFGLGSVCMPRMMTSGMKPMWKMRCTVGPTYSTMSPTCRERISAP